MDFPVNLIWIALTGSHAGFATGAGDVRRYGAGLPPMVAFRDPQAPALDALCAISEAGEDLYCALWDGEPWGGWSIQAQGTMARLVWRGDSPTDDRALSARPLGTADVPGMLDLVALTRPGPFGPRNLELGNYYGCFEGDRLVAMAGERIQAGRLREISAVCTHPDYQGRGLGRRLVNRLVREQLARGETPFLHVMDDNLAARTLYQRMGFAEQRSLVVRVIQRS